MDEEQFTLTNENDEEIACVQNNAGSDRAVIMVHGFTGDKREQGAFDDAAAQFVDHGYSVIRFDCRGSGESALSFTEMAISTEAADVSTVYAYAAEQFDSVAVVGLSMGALAVIRSDVPACSYALWSPALDMKTLFERRYLENKDWGELLSQDTVDLPFGDDTVTVGHPFVKEVHDISYDATMAAVDTPTLIVYGSQDFLLRKADVEDWKEQFTCPTDFATVAGDHLLRPKVTLAVDKTVKWCNKWCEGGAG